MKYSETFMQGIDNAIAWWDKEDARQEAAPLKQVNVL